MYLVKIGAFWKKVFKTPCGTFTRKKDLSFPILLFLTNGGSCGFFPGV